MNTHSTMDYSQSLKTHPATAADAKAFSAPGSLSYPGGVGAGDLTPPSEKDGSLQANGNSAQTNGAMNGQQKQGANAGTRQGNGVTPTTPAATPGAATTSASGIVPTLQ